MNVNLTSAVESPKVTNVTKSSLSQDLVSGESGESKGFLDKLVSLLLGKSEPSASDSATVATDTKSMVSADVEATSVDELLVKDDEATAKADVVSDDEIAEIPENLKQFVQSEQDEDADLQAKAVKAMDDGDKLLGRLQEANQTLNGNGKALPLDKGEELQSEQADAILPYVQQQVVTQQTAQPNKLDDANGENQELNQQASMTTAPAAIAWGVKSDKAQVAEEAAYIANEQDGKIVAKNAAHATQTPQTVLSQADKAMLVQSLQASQSQQPQHLEAQVPLQQAASAQANPLLTSTMANQIEPTGNQAALQAGLGAKALSSLMGGNKRAEGSADSPLAQQLSAAMGQQGLNSPQALRSEPLQVAQQNMPLQLSRGDMAAEQMAERVQVMLSKNLKNIDIRLDPPELGRMHIRMNMNGDGATVHFTVANQQARDALEQSMPRLREMLNNQGVQLGDTSVQQQSSGQQQRYAASGDGSGAQSVSGDHLQSEENLDTNVKLDLNVAAKRDGISYYA
ncbi:MAG: flagellar hook-length control protein FliK [Vibrio sp.]|uniref:flagellar hook-length control protein FliK n=1 Tax=Vibrio sp. TaxID=678 RepID=UPI003A8BF517